jgi:3D (Asp-Asp-Asp) domain-containing protein
MRRGPTTMFFLYLLLLMALILGSIWVMMYNEHSYRKQTKQEMEQMKLELRKTQEVLREQEKLLQKVDVLMQKQEILLDALHVDEFEVTAYAPLAPAAIEGMCYSGNPYITATGARTTPGRTIATDPSVIPMGSRVWIPDVGVRVAEDTGGTIVGYEIDLCLWTQKEAREWGRRKVAVIWANTAKPCTKRQ